MVAADMRARELSSRGRGFVSVRLVDDLLRSCHIRTPLEENVFIGNSLLQSRVSLPEKLGWRGVAWEDPYHGRALENMFTAWGPPRTQLCLDRGQSCDVCVGETEHAGGME